MSSRPFRAKLPHVCPVSWLLAAPLVLLPALACSSGEARDDAAAVASDVSSPAPSACATPSVTVTCTAASEKTTGLAAPLATCAQAPCAQPLGAAAITSDISPPSCVYSPSSGASQPQTILRYADPWASSGGDASANERYTCVSTPPAQAGKVPLVVFFHGSHGGADDVYDYTQLFPKSQSYAWPASSGGGTGFYLASIQGRNLNWPDPNPGGPHHDYFFRDLSTSSCNPDVWNADQTIDRIVQTYANVDPSRIYVMGWSNGAYFAEMYATGRQTQPTAGGHYVAGAAVYAGSDPYNNTVSTQSPSCALSQYPRTSAPIYLIHRSCDSLVPCNVAQEGGRAGSPPTST